MAYGYYPTYQQFPFQQQYQQQYQQPAQTMQAGGFISVRSIDEAFNWPVAPGNSLMFKDENSPYVYTKTRGFSQLDQPVFEKYRLVKEGDAPQPIAQPQVQNRDDITALWEEVRLLQSQVDELKAGRSQRRKKDEQSESVQPVQPVHAEPRADAQ